MRKRRRPKKQTLRVVKDLKYYYWVSDAPGSVPHRVIEMQAACFPVGTTIEVRYPKRKESKYES